MSVFRTFIRFGALMVVAILVAAAKPDRLCVGRAT